MLTMTTTQTATETDNQVGSLLREANMANLQLGQVVVNFGTTAMVVGFFKAAGGPSEHDGSPILRELSADRRRFIGDKWIADPSKVVAL